MSNPTLEIVRDQTLKFRQMCARIAESEKMRANVIPPLWKNNIRWHIGHLVWVPRVLTFGLMKEPVGLPETYRKWFAKGTSPADWGTDPVPSIVELLAQLEPTTIEMFDKLEARLNEPFPQPYPTSVGVQLKTPLESLIFSQSHDGIHLGMLLAIKRELG